MARNRALFVSAAAALGMLACVKTLPVDGYPCRPGQEKACADGWQCCRDVCIPESQVCSCVPDCSGGRCGPNECGASCGACVCNGKTCRLDQVCTPVGRCGTVAAMRPSKLMLALDKSGSMKTLATSDTQWGCASDGNGNGYNANGDCKWISLVRLLAEPSGFLDQTASRARIGLAVFSDPNIADSCAAGGIEVPLPDTAGASVSAIKGKLAGYVPVGGTPSASTMHSIASDFAFTRSEEATTSFVILVTDGLPNCNSSMNPSACNACTNGGDPANMCNDVRNCLDSEALFAAIRTLRAKGIYTLVIGFGSAFNNPDAKQVLDQAAEEGGRPQQDQSTKFYFAENEASLAAILDKIVPSTGTCLFSLDHAPTDPESVQVFLKDLAAPTSGNGVELFRGPDWDYADDTHTTVSIKGDRCLFIQNAPDGRYQLSFSESVPL